MKQLVAQELAKRVKDGEIIGVGTGSTVDLALIEIGKRVQQEKLNLHVVPTSLQSSWRCQEIGLHVLYPGYRAQLSWGFDGADEVNEKFWLIKGKGGALLQEKILAARCKEFIVIVDESKIVPRLGAACAIPVEVIPEALAIVEREMPKRGAKELTLRNAVGGKHGPIITEAGNIIVDVLFSEVHADLEHEIKSVVGVVESGLFIDYATEVMVASATQVKKLSKK